MMTSAIQQGKLRQMSGLLLVLWLGMFLRTYAIDRESIWLDEAFSVWMASHPLPTLIDWAVRIDQHPPLYYILLRGWIALFGDGPAAVRLLSSLCSVATLPLLYRLACRLIGDVRTARISLALLAVSPFHVQYAQEARMYALLTLLVTATIYLAWLLWVLPGAEDIRGSGKHNFGQRLAVASGVALCQGGAMLTHNVAAVFLPLILNVAAIGRWQRQGQFPTRLWAGTQVAAFLLWWPWAGSFVVQAQGVDRRFWLQPPSLADLIDALRTFTFAFLPADFSLAGPGLILFAGLAVLGALRCRPSPRWLLLNWLTLPIVGLLLVSLRRPLFHLPSLLPFSLPYYIVLAGGFSAISKASSGRQYSVLPWWRLCLSLFVVLNGVSLYSYYNHNHKEAWDEAAAYVTARIETGDLLLFNASWVQLPFDYYFDAENKGVNRHGLPVDLFDSGELEPAMTVTDLPRLRRLSADYQRIWLIYSHNWFTDPQGLIPATLAQDKDLIAEKAFTGIHIYLFESQTPPKIGP